jgi:hypothetical protein
MPEQVAWWQRRYWFAHMNRLLPLLVLLFLSCGACKKSSETKSVPASTPIQDRRIQQPDSTEPKIPACTLITTDEVGAIQGATIADAKSSEGPSGALMMSQCYYSAREPNKSVSLAVIQPSAKSVTGTETRDYWASTFGRFAQGSLASDEEKKEKDQKLGEMGEEEKKRIPPKKVAGVGEEAYWSGNRFGGALYVLKGDAFLRISVGGPDNEETKLEKSKALAQKALSRF